jgi:asparagine synthase (glutamine-hydrolysing)
MCGLAGFWRSTPVSAELLRKASLAMAAAIDHRGPDDAGVWCDPMSGFVVAHRRLAILDLSSAGHQPMLSASERYVIAFNGEIYNHQKIRQVLVSNSALQQTWCGNSDTETLLAAIEAWGLVRALRFCVGMFAFALFDRRERKLHLVRDRFGEKPLYWGWQRVRGQEVLVFSSELAALRALPESSPSAVNPAALSAYFRWGCIPAPLCIYAGLQQLPPGHIVSIPAGTSGCAPSHLPSSQPWWQLQVEATSAYSDVFTSSSEALNALEGALQRAVGEQAIADVSVGAFLSGGIDSSLITALLQAQSSRQVRSFTIAYPDEAGFNEAPYARSIAHYLGTAHTEVGLTSSDALNLIPSLPRLFSEPFADSSQIPTHLVCREARRSGLTVALSGDGADELFGGYNRHRLVPLLQHRFGRLPHIVRYGIARGLECIPVSKKGLARDKRRKLSAAIQVSSSLNDLYRAITCVWPDPSAVLQPQWWSSVDPIDPWPIAPSPSEELMLADACTYLPADILVKVDRAAMAASLETRAPFLDHRVASVAWGLPLCFKIHSGSGKWLLRQLLGRYVPLELIDRPKAGFAIPIGAWLRGPLHSWAENLISPELLQRQGFLQSETIQRLWRAHQRGADYTPQLWSVLMWQAWLLEWG